MPEIRRDAVCQRVDYLCDKCEAGVMITVSSNLAFVPGSTVPQAQHLAECNHCHHRQVMNGPYPRIEHGATTAIMDIDGHEISGSV